MEVLLLGPVAVVEGDRAVTIRQRRQRALLALLALRAGETVAVDRLVEDLWGAEAPRTALASLHNAVSQLRKLLGPEIVVTRDPGYAVDGAVTVDVARFEQLLTEARSARSMRDEETAATILREALGMWRGPALADLAYEPFAQAEIRRLEELRQGALEERVDSDLALGRHTDLVPELEALVAEEPLRERLHGQLMLALYRSERQADALAAYRTARATLVEELGIEPGPELKQLHAAVLRQDETLLLPGELPAAPAAPMQFRRLATILVVSGSTDETDPETLHAVLGRFFEVVDAIVSGHGGATERMAGDAVMAAFGVSTADENPALRAVRAAADIRAATAGAEGDGPRCDARVSIATGEVLVSGGGSRRPLVTGEPISVAAALQRVAAPGQVVIGPLTHRLVGTGATVEPLGDVDVPSRAKPVAAFGLLDVSTEQATIGSLLDTPLVGRKAELRTLRATLREAKAGASVSAVCLLGPAGIGKSRLAREVLRGARGFDVLIGRCRSHGRGITYWPLREIVGDDTDAIAATLGDRRAAELLVHLEGPAPEIAWAFRRWCEARAERRPVLVAVDDLHWAEPTFLDLLEQLVGHGSGRIGLLVLARDDLLEEHPDFLAGHATRVQLEGLAVAETQALVDELLAGAPLPPDVRARVFETAEGNPLFVEQLVALAAEGDIAAGPEQQLPATIQALLAARLDRLGPGERAVLERAAIVGREFTAEHVTALLEPPAVPTAERHLASLTRRAFVQVRASGGYRFRHGLVQDATYRATPKKVRTELHERLADRLDRQGDAGDALVGYHLERAYRLRSELGAADRATLRLAEDAGRRLGLAGIRAWKRHDAPAAGNLLRRAVELLPEREPRRLELLCELATVRKWTMDDPGAEELLGEVATLARETGLERLRLRAEIERAWPRFTRGEASADEIVSLATRAIWVFEADGDDRAAGRAWIVLAAARGPMQLRYASCEEAAERALVHYERAGYSPTPCFSLLASAASNGPTPVANAVERCQALLASPTSDRSARAHLEIFLALLETMRGDLPRARAYLTTSQTHVVSEGGAVAPDWIDVAARLSVLEGDTASATRLLQEESAKLAGHGDHAWVATFAAFLAEIAVAEHRYDEGLAHATRARDLAPASDLLAQVNWRRAMAKAVVRLNEPDEARRLATEACALLSGSDALVFRADAALDLAEVLHLASRHDEAIAPADEALTLFEVKRDRTGLERARRRLAGLAPLASA